MFPAALVVDELNDGYGCFAYLSLDGATIIARRWGEIPVSIGCADGQADLSGLRRGFAFLWIPESEFLERLQKRASGQRGA